MMLYAATIFCSAFLLFLLQPIIAKQILPWFGGSAAVWTTCLVFFQAVLLARLRVFGRARPPLRPRAAKSLLHVLLLVSASLLLPIIPAASWKPLGGEEPSWRILGLLTTTVGLPYFLLSTTSPLVQAWFSRSYPGRSPYRLFALSNLASMLALLGYPFVLERTVTTRMQSYGWSAGYVLFVPCARGAPGTACGGHPVAAGVASVDEASPARAEAAEAPPTKARQVLWATLAAMGTFLLLAVSNHICQNISAIPLLWILPLSIYLLTFILCFDSTRWYRRELFLAMVAAMLGVMAWTLAYRNLAHELKLQISVFCIGLFIACMFCHGELARLKPAPRYLTRFYLMVSLGGAVGSALVGLVAPLVLPAYFELASVSSSVPVCWCCNRGARTPSSCSWALRRSYLRWVRPWWAIRDFYDGTLAASRNFYGVLRVQEFGAGTSSDRRSLVHGTILHGTQYQAPELKHRATTYYTQTSGVGRVLESLNPRTEPLRVGVIGLGTGTIATYGSTGDVYRFYDINPAVVKVAHRDFTYLDDSEARIETPLGDARLTLERDPPQHFDVLAIDAFSSDSIPVHLITFEALAVYRKHMKPGGIIAFHVTNRFLDLIPVVKKLADEHHMQAVLIADDGSDSTASRSDWVLVADDASSFKPPAIAEAAKAIEPRNDWALWTDDFNNIVQVLK